MTLPDHIKQAIYSGPVPTLRNWRELPLGSLTRGERVCRFCEDHLVIPEGAMVGQPLKLADFQEAFLLAVYDNPHDTNLAIFSLARKNAKTGLIAFMVLAHTVGPEAQLNSRLNSGAMSRQQASEVYNYASKSAMLSETIAPLVKCTPSSKTIAGLPLNTEYRALSADASTNIGGSPVFAVLDELGQVRGPRSDFIDAITTAQAAHENPMLVYISTQSATDADLLSVTIDDAKNSKPARTVCHVYTGDAGCDVLDEEQWRKANPALGLFRSERDMREQAEKASRMPSFEAAFRNLLLNQRISTVSPFVSPSVWATCGGIPADLEGLTVYGGLDLSARTDLTALVLMAYDEDGVAHVQPYFWTPEEGLRDRAKRDRSPYDQWAHEGHLRTTPGATVDYAYVAADIADILSSMDVGSIAFDRWRIDVFQKELDRLEVDLPMEAHGQGYKDMSVALDTLEAELLNGRLRHGNHPVLSMCAANAVVSKDPAGNRKLDKHKATGRIDGMVSLAMALGVAAKPHDEAIDLDSFLADPLVL